MKNNNRISELNEVAAMAFQDGDFDMLEQLYSEIQEIIDTTEVQSLASVYFLDNSYCNNTPRAQLISDRINAMIQAYSRETVLAYWNNETNQVPVMLSVHFSNLFLTYGTESIDEVMAWIDFKEC